MLRGALATGVALVLALAIIGCGSGAKPSKRPATPAAARHPAAEAVGASVNRLFNDMTDTPAQLSAQLAALRATGATIARSDALWEATEPAAPRDGVHHYAWTFDDTVAGDLAQHGLTWLPILDYSAPWAQSIPGQDHSPPRSAADYAAYARAFAARYGAGGTFWRLHPEMAPLPVTAIEVWNEPDSGEFWSPRPDAAGYARLYAATRDAVHAVDPTARVIVGGLVDAAGFLPAMIGARPSGTGEVDGVAVHPYGTPDVVLGKVRAARGTLAALGLGNVPLYVTEVGWTTSPPGALDYVPAARRPAWIEQTVRALSGGWCGVAATVLYTWVTPQRNPADSQDWFGIHDPDGASTPSSVAFTAGGRAAAATSPAAPCGQ